MLIKSISVIQISMYNQYYAGGPLSPRLSTRARSPGAVIGSRVLSPRGTYGVSTGLMAGATIPTGIASTGSLPIAATSFGNDFVMPAGVSSATAIQQAPMRGESRMEYIPYQRKYIDYESREYTDKVPVERTVIDYKEVKRVEYVPRQKQITDYYAIEYQTSYVPQTIPEKKIEYVPVETVTERVEYFPVEKQVVHYPEETLGLSRRNIMPAQAYQTMGVSTMPVTRPGSHYAGISSRPNITTVSSPGEVITTTINQTYYPAQTYTSGQTVYGQTSPATLNYASSMGNGYSSGQNQYTYTVHSPSEIERKSSNGYQSGYQSGYQGGYQPNYIQPQSKVQPVGVPSSFNSDDYQYSSMASNGIRTTQFQRQ